eukprot:350760-Chlamydomonas_euryale.AAC.4
MLHVNDLDGQHLGERRRALDLLVQAPAQHVQAAMRGVRCISPYPPARAAHAQRPMYQSIPTRSCRACAASD